MKRFLPLLASILLLAACGTNSSTSTPASISSEPASQTSQKTDVLTFINDGEIYIDFNFDNAPQGLSLKIGNTTVTESGKATMSKDFAFELNGTFGDSVNIYYVIDAKGSASAGKSEGVDGDRAKSMIERYFANYASKQYEYRVYFCLSDKASGWSKTLPGVDGTIRSYSGNY